LAPFETGNPLATCEVSRYRTGVNACAYMGN